jgi:hypothetical protein
MFYLTKLIMKPGQIVRCSGAVKVAQRASKAVEKGAFRPHGRPARAPEAPAAGSRRQKRPFSARQEPTAAHRLEGGSSRPLFERRWAVLGSERESVLVVPSLLQPWAVGTSLGSVCRGFQVVEEVVPLDGVRSISCRVHGLEVFGHRL